MMHKEVGDMQWERQELNGPMGDLETFRPLIEKMSWAAAQRACKLSLPLDQDDFRQELSIKYFDCLEKWNPNEGASFLNFFITSGWRRVNAIFGWYERDKRKDGLGMLSLDVPVSDHPKAGTMMDFIEDENLANRPEYAVDGELLIDAIRECLSGEALTLFDILCDPPAEFIRQEDIAPGGNGRESNASTARLLLNLKPSKYAQLKLDIYRALFKVSPEIKGWLNRAGRQV